MTTIIAQLILIMVSCVITWRTAVHDLGTKKNKEQLRGYLIIFAIVSMILSGFAIKDSNALSARLEHMDKGIDTLGLKYNDSTKTIDFKPMAGIVATGDHVNILNNTVQGNGADRFRPGVFRDSLTLDAQKALAGFLLQKYKNSALKKTSITLMISSSQALILNQVDSIIRATGGEVLGITTAQSTQEFPAPQLSWVSEHRDTTSVMIGYDPIAMRNYYRNQKQ